MTAVLLLFAGAMAASAHVEISPDTSAPGAEQLYTVQVPNERDDQATVQLDLTLPAGFELDVAQTVPGWETVVTKKDGVPVSVTWKGGRIPVGTFASFQVFGRNPKGTSQLTWRATQRYETTTVTWDGPATSQNPAPVVELVPGGAEALTAPVTATSSEDSTARFRAAWGLGLAAAALIVALLSTAAARRRATPGRSTVPTPRTDADTGETDKTVSASKGAAPNG